MQSRSVLLKNMFDPEEYANRFSPTKATKDFNRETEHNWEKDLAEEVKQECEGQYGKVEAIKVEKDSQARRVVLRLISLADGTEHRGKYTSNSARSSPPRRPFKDSTAVGLVVNKSVQTSFRMP